MESGSKKNFIIIFSILVIAIGLRLFFLLRARSEARNESAPVETAAPANTDWDQFVKPRKTYAYDAASAKKELAGTEAWVKAGNQLSYYPYDPRTRQANLGKELGLLPPLEKIKLQDFITQRAPSKLKPGEVAVVRYEVLASFTRPEDKQQYAVQVGTLVADETTLFLNDTFFFEDPRELYKHWSADTWKAIEQHEVKEGMNELQASLAVGSSMSAGPGNYGDRVVEYTNNDRPVQVTFAHNKAIKVVTETLQKD